MRALFPTREIRDKKNSSLTLDFLTFERTFSPVFHIANALKASEMAPELPRFASLAEQRLRANNPSHPANAATEFLSAPELPRPLAPRSALASSPSPPSGNQPLALYDNETPGIPSHWIPLYGATHGMFYDPFTKMFMNDGAPRPTVHRTDGTTPCASNEGVAAAAAAHPVGNIEDALHVQRSTLTTPHLDRPYAPANNQYYCWCTGRWLSSPHNCALDASVVPAGAGAPIRPGTVLPANWVTHVAPIRDTSYVERMGLSSQLDAQIDSAVQEALLEMANEPDEPVEAPTTRASRPLSMADLAAAGFPMPTRRPARQPTAPPAPSTTGEALAPRDIGTSVPDNRQARRAAAKEAEKAAKKAGLARGGRGGGRGGQGSSRGGRGGGGAGAGQWIAAS